ncbi:MAG TPA: hypothetical protein VM286_06380 [Candidatus Thermoplasmatota archaeon]|nr:hypothetical protein [Candidatus Thermoplasmatota archaeon]
MNKILIAILVSAALAGFIVWDFFTTGPTQETILKFTSYSGPTTTYAYNLTDEEARSLPGRLPEVFNQVDHEGLALAKFTNEKELQRFLHAMQYSDHPDFPHLVRYHDKTYEWSWTVS